MDRFKDFKQVCGETPDRVRIWDDALKDAGSVFSIYGAVRLKDVIGSDGLEEVAFIHNAPLDLDPRFTVHDYTFQYAGVFGYLAIFKDAKDKWVLKSFKQDVTKSKMINNPFEALLTGYSVKKN